MSDRPGRTAGGRATLRSLLEQVLIRDPGEPRTLLWHALVNGVLANSAIPARLRTVGYRVTGMRVSYRCLVRPSVVFRSGHVTIGPATTINYRCLFDDRAGVTIGSGVGIGANVTFTTSTHDLAESSRRAGTGRLAPIVVEDGCWIGSGVTILAGVTIGHGCVVAAGAVVHRDCLPDGLYGGVPAKRLRDLP